MSLSVVGPTAIPVIVDADAAGRDPEVAVLSAIAHGGDEPELAVRIATAALAGVVRLDDERALLYSDLIRISLPPKAALAGRPPIARRTSSSADAATAGVRRALAQGGRP